MARMNRLAVTNALAFIILIVGFSQMAGFVLDLRAVRAIGAASVIAPLPKVFADVDGVETFASRFVLEYTRPDGKNERLEITPKVYGMIDGPYNRRNVYGAALSYGPTPRFPRALFDAVFEYGLIQPGPLRREMGIQEGSTGFRLRIETKTRGRDDVWVMP